MLARTKSIVFVFVAVVHVTKKKKKEIETDLEKLNKLINFCEQKRRREYFPRRSYGNKIVKR